jgi:hypothetical protein
MFYNYPQKKPENEKETAIAYIQRCSTVENKLQPIKDCKFIPKSSTDSKFTWIYVTQILSLEGYEVGRIPYVGWTSSIHPFPSTAFSLGFPRESPCYIIINNFDIDGGLKLGISSNLTDSERLKLDVLETYLMWGNWKHNKKLSIYSILKWITEKLLFYMIEYAENRDHKTELVRLRIGQNMIMSESIIPLIHRQMLCDRLIQLYWSRDALLKQWYIENVLPF